MDDESPRGIDVEHNQAVAKDADFTVRSCRGSIFAHAAGLVKTRWGALRRTPRGTTSVIHRREWTERAMCRKRQAGFTEPRGIFVFNHGETDMGDKGSKDKGKREQQKKAQPGPKEKRKLKNEKRKNK